MPVSKVVFFDGVDDYVNVGHGASLDLIANLTLCSRIKKVKSHNYYQLLVAKTTGTMDVQNSYLLYTNIITGEIRFRIDNGAALNANDTGYNLPLNRWVYVVAVLSAGFLKVYVDGNKIAADTVRTVNPQSQPNWDVYIAGSAAWTPPTPGYFASTQIYNRALSDSEVLYNAMHPNNPKRQGLALNLTQDSILGAQWLDLSGNNNHGTYTNGAVPVSANLLCGR
jgi:hypothetical protein